MKNSPTNGSKHADAYYLPDPPKNKKDPKKAADSSRSFQKYKVALDKFGVKLLKNSISSKSQNPKKTIYDKTYNTKDQLDVDKSQKSQKSNRSFHHKNPHLSPSKKVKSSLPNPINSTPPKKAPYQDSQDKGPEQTFSTGKRDHIKFGSYLNRYYKDKTQTHSHIRDKVIKSSHENVDLMIGADEPREQANVRYEKGKRASEFEGNSR